MAAPLKLAVDVFWSATDVDDLTVAPHQLVLYTVDDPRVVGLIGSCQELYPDLGGATYCHVSSPRSGP